MKLFKKICIAVLTVAVIYILASIAMRAYVRKNTTVIVFNERYTLFDSSVGNFIPFGADNNSYEENVGYYNLFGLSFSKNDPDRNFIYCNDLLGSTVYIKRSYDLPLFPPTDMIDEIIISYEAEEDRRISVKDRDGIEAIANYLSALETTADGNNENLIVFYAVSKSLGGTYQLNERGSIYMKKNNKIGYGSIITGELPDEMQDIIMSYIDSNS